MKSQLITTSLFSLIFFLSACSEKPDDQVETMTEVAEQVSDDETPTRFSTAQVMEAMTDDDWRDIEQDNLLYMELATGTILIELAPQFAPNHVENIKTLVREDYFDGLYVIRSHDNYVAQWGEAETETPKSLGSAKPSLAPEWERSWPEDLPVTLLPDGDIYQADAGYAFGFPVAGDKNSGKIGMAHCYGMLGVGRGGTADSGNGSSLYVVTGHSPRHLDRNVTLAGRVWQGIEHLSSLPRGTGPLGFYETPEEYADVISISLGNEMAEEDRVYLQVLKTDTGNFANYIEARRYRVEDWFLDPAGALELCNLPMPVRARP